MRTKVKVLSAASIGFSANSSICSMMTEDEQALYFVTARSYRGAGSVIEIGPWLGSGTTQICRGLDASSHDWTLTVYDRFTWNSVAQRKYPEGGLQVGESFLPLFDSNLQPYRQRIMPITAELRDISSKLPISGQIELLFVDAPKSWSMLRLVLMFSAHISVQGRR